MPDSGSASRPRAWTSAMRSIRRACIVPAWNARFVWHRFKRHWRYPPVEPTAPPSVLRRMGQAVIISSRETPRRCMWCGASPECLPLEHRAAVPFEQIAARSQDLALRQRDPLPIERIVAVPILEFVPEPPAHAKDIIRDEFK